MELWQSKLRSKAPMNDEAPMTSAIIYHTTHIHTGLLMSRQPIYNLLNHYNTRQNDIMGQQRNKNHMVTWDFRLSPTSSFISPVELLSTSDVWSVYCFQSAPGSLYPFYIATTSPMVWDVVKIKSYRFHFHKISNPVLDPRRRSLSHGHNMGVSHSRYRTESRTANN